MNIEQALQKTLGFGAKTFIEKAVEGGWKTGWFFAGEEYFSIYGNETKMFSLYKRGRENKIDETLALCSEQILLDPLAWQAVGKVEGWGTYNEYDVGVAVEVRFMPMKPDSPLPSHIEEHQRQNRIKYRIEKAAHQVEREDWQFHMHRFIDTLTEEV